MCEVISLLASNQAKWENRFSHILDYTVETLFTYSTGQRWLCLLHEVLK
jgi:hypothetical protein